MPRTNDLAVAVAQSLYPHMERLDQQAGERAQCEQDPAAGRQAWVEGAAEVIRETLGDLMGWRPCGCSEAERPECERCGGEGVLVVWGTTEGQPPA